MCKVKIFLILLLVSSSPLFPQSIYVGLGAGLNIIKGDNYYTSNFGSLGVYQSVNGTVTNFAGMDLSNELQFQINGKYFFNNSPFSLIAGLQYLRMTGNESVPIYSGTFKMPISQNVTTEMDIWNFKLGANYSFNISHLKPFISAALLSNYFDDVFVRIGDDENYSQFLSYKNGMRYGYSIGTGLGYDVFQNIELELSTNYNSFNVLNKRSGESLLNSIGILLNVYYKVY